VPIEGCEHDRSTVARTALLESLRDQPERLGRLAALMHENAAQVQRIKFVWLNVEYLPVERLTLVQLPALMLRDGAPQRVGKIGFP
jgi:hypothetical protein